MYCGNRRPIQRGNAGFQNKRSEFRGEMSIEECKARIKSLKEHTSYKKCGQKGPWADDLDCPKGTSKDK